MLCSWQLVGEYVLEIIETISRGLPEVAVPGSAQRRLYRGSSLGILPSSLARSGPW
jgi:hypothetical protein